MAALDLQDDPYKALREAGTNPVPEGGVTALDLGRNIIANTYGVGSGVAGAAQYLTGADEDSYLAQARRFTEAGTERWEQSMSPAARRAASATFIPQQGKSSIWDEDVSASGAVALLATGSIPSLVASLVPGGIAARVALRLGAAAGAAGAVGTAVGGGIDAAQNAGDVFNDIQNAILKEPDTKLQQDSEIYRGMRMSGMSEQDAKDRVINSAVGYKPIIAGAITALTSRYGVEGIVARRAAGKTTAHGALREAGMGFAGESTQEFGEETSGALLKQAGAADARGQPYKFDWIEALDAGLKGAVAGGLTGAAVGGASGMGRRHPAGVNDRPIDADHEAALTGTPLEITVSPSGVTPEPRVVTPEAAPTGPEVVLDQKRAVAGQEMDALDKTTKDAGANAGVVQHVDTQPTAPAAPVGVGVDEAAALSEWDDPIVGKGDPDAFIADDLEPSDTAPPIPPVPDVPVVAPQVQQAITTPVQAAVQPAEPRLEPQPRQEAGVPAPAQPATERAAAPALEPTPAIEPAPVVPTGRIIEGGQAVKDKSGQLKSPTAKNAPRMGKLKKAQIEAGVAPEKVLTAKELRTKARQDELAGLAERVRAAQAKLPEPDVSKGAPAARAYARELAAAAEIGNVKLGNLAADADPALHLIKRAVQTGKGAGTASDAIAFAGSDIDVRKGGTVGPRVVGGVSFNEDIGESEGTKGGAVRNEAEEEVTEEIDTKRAAARRAELEKAEAAAQAASRAEAEKKTAAAMQNLVAGEAKRPVMVERKRVVTPPGKRENLFERRRREAEEKEREAAAEVERTRKRRETDREKGIAEMLALMREQDEVVAGKTDFIDAALPVQDIADKIEAVHRRLETALGSVNAAAQAYRSAVQQHAQVKRQAAGDATATTPAAAVAQLQTQRAEENRDVPLLRDSRTAALLDETAPPETRTLGEMVRQENLFPEGSTIHGAARLMMTEMAGRLRTLAKTTPVRILSPEDFAAHIAEVRPDHKGEADGIYDWRTDEITIRSDKQNDPTLIIHEGMHAAYHRAMEDRPDVKKAVGHMMDAVTAQVLKEAEALGFEKIGLPYGLTNEHEFVADAWTDNAFTKLLARTPASPEAGPMVHGWKRPFYSVWDALVRHVKKVLFNDGGPSATVLDQLMRATQQLDITAEKQRANGRGGPPLLRSDETRTVNVKEAMASLANTAGDRRGAAADWWRDTGLKVTSFKQIERIWGHYFDSAPGEGNPVSRIIDALSSQETLAAEKMAVGHSWAQKFKELGSVHGRAVMDAASRLMIDATRAGVYLGPKADNSHLSKTGARDQQRRAQLPRLQAQFDALPADLQSFILDSAEYFTSTQNELVKADISNILQAHDATLSPQAYAQLTKNTMEGTLGPDDLAILDSQSVFNMLDRATGFRAVKGIYFPQMRHGKFVVRTKEHLGETYGGKVIHTDPDGSVVLEWLAPKDKQARGGFNQFADNASAIITSVGKKRFLPDGTEVSDEGAKGRTHNVAYRARVQLNGVSFFDSRAEARRFIREQGPSFAWTDKKQLTRAEADAQGALSNRQFTSIMSSINGRNDLTASQKQIATTALKQAAIRSLAGNRISQRSLPRKNVTGASHDIPRNIVQYASSASFQLAAMRAMPKAQAALRDMHELVKNQREHVDTPVRSEVLREITSRLDQNMINTKEDHWAVKDLKMLTFMARLGSPMYSVIQAMQPHMFTVPELAGPFGPLRSMAAVNRAFNSIGAGGLTLQGITNTYTAMRHLNAIGLDTDDPVAHILKHIQKEPDAAFLTTLINELRRTSDIAPEAGLEIASTISAGRGPVPTFISKFERILRQLPITMEAINRAVSGVAAARLGRSAGMTEEQAIAYARDVIDKTQGTYANWNQPRVFNNRMFSPALQFKKFAQFASVWVADMVRKSFSPKTPRREREIALRQLSAMLVTQMAMAGAVGLPGLELLKVGFMVAAALGLSDSWEDKERKLRKWFEGTVGKSWAEMLSHGVLSRGIAQFIPFPDLSSRVGLGDMWLFGEPKGSDRESTQAYLFNVIGGAPAGLMLDWRDAANHAGNGEFLSAASKFIPVKMLADLGKAIKGSASGDMTMTEAVMQTMGARSARLAEKGEVTGGSVAVSRKAEEDRKLLSRQYIDAGSAGELLKIKARIIAHNNQIKESGRNSRQLIGINGLDKVRAEKAKERRALRGD